MSQPILNDNIFRDLKKIRDDISVLQRSASQADRLHHGRMSWSGTASVSSSVYHAVESDSGLTGLGITPTCDFDSSSTDYVTANSIVDLANGQLIAPTTGLYLLSARAHFQSSATAGMRAVLIRRTDDSPGNVAIGSGPSSTSNQAIATCTDIYPASAGDAFEINFYQTTGAGLNLQGFLFSACLLSSIPAII
jgi:hypothetical protein